MAFEDWLEPDTTSQFKTHFRGIVCEAVCGACGVVNPIIFEPHTPEYLELIGHNLHLPVSYICYDCGNPATIELCESSVYYRGDQGDSDACPDPSDKGHEADSP